MLTKMESWLLEASTKFGVEAENPMKSMEERLENAIKQ